MPKANAPENLTGEQEKKTEHRTQGVKQVCTASKQIEQMDDINPLYLAADVLITDYSSVFFDYANLRRPILFFMYDYEQYKHEMRDFYFDIHMLPGPVLMNQEEVLKTLKNLPNMVDKYEKKYAEFNNVFNPHRERCSEKYLREWMR